MPTNSTEITEVERYLKRGRVGHADILQPRARDIKVRDATKGDMRSLLVPLAY